MLLFLVISVMHLIHHSSPVLQVEGAFVQGIGFFVNEEHLSNSDGLVVTDGTWTYKPPTVDTIPREVNVELFSSGYHQKHLLSSKGIACLPV